VSYLDSNSYRDGLLVTRLARLGFVALDDPKLRKEMCDAGMGVNEINTAIVQARELRQLIFDVVKRR